MARTMKNKETVLFYHHNKIRLSGFYFTFLWKISSTQWISPVKDGFHCEVLLRLRGFLHALRLVEMTVLFYHHNKIRLSGFYFTFLWKISSTQWISPVDDGFHCEAPLRLRGFLHAFHLYGITVLFLMDIKVLNIVVFYSIIIGQKTSF